MPKTPGAKYLDGEHTVTILAITMSGYLCEHSLWGETVMQEGDLDALKKEYTKGELEAQGQTRLMD